MNSLNSLPDAQWCRERYQELHTANMQASQLPAVIEGLQALFERAIPLNEFRVAAGCAMLLSLDYKRLGEWASSIRWAGQARDVAMEHFGWPMASNASKTLAQVTYDYARDLPSSEIFSQLVSLLTDGAERDGRHHMFEDQADKYGFLSDVELVRAAKLEGVSTQDAFQNSLTWLAEAEVLIPQLPEELQLYYMAENIYKRSNAYYAINDISTALVYLQHACNLFQEAGKEREAALMNKRIGLLNLLSVERDTETTTFSLNETLERFQRSEAFLKTVGFQEQLADCHLQQAWAWERALLQGHEGALEHALRNLDTAEQIRNEIRMDFTLRRDANSLVQKQALVSRSADLYTLGFELSLKGNDTRRSWWWLQQGKARGLLDLIGFGADMPKTIKADIFRDKTASRLWEQEAAILQQLSVTPPGDRFRLRESLANLRRSMNNHRTLHPALVYRGARSLELDQLESMFDSRTDVVCVDWAVVHNKLLMVSVRPGQEPKISELEILLSDVVSWIQTNMRPTRLRQSSATDRLRNIDPLVAPLATNSNEGELLVFCPTNILSGLPLHALNVGQQVIIERNPVIYSTSLSILQHCLQRQGRARPKSLSVAILADPTSDRAAATESASNLGSQMNTDPLIGTAATAQAFKCAAERVDIFHYHGHVRFDVNEPLESAFKLAGEQEVTARDLFSIQMRPKLFTMIACESGRQRILPGDEPLGLMPVLLLAGANAVVGTMWNCWDTAGKEFTESFYHSIHLGWKSSSRSDQEPLPSSAIDLALALREAVLGIRKRRPEPYFWALFVLYGNWNLVS
ncbi:CHAT domain-containing protein [Aspergillus fijiensis CBS 313.89]|uniref:CHAT domain-containing protein n=1 Tax=Aspergillus fijiensis CBS 313.89 TaxID=1448319 RepID=A0A8G1VYF8_9EURO|nr:uncharacterized protein BO72DRAFT_486024 [Aspergillus fijiensis CBS 313.89]RAK77207.1 hypothetical protein BO72DRAFT_486024 [Aspergillus fijiensis CBS 313.89]